MKGRSGWVAAGLLIPAVTLAWLPLDHHYAGRTIRIQTGDICDSVRFPETPGTCAGDAGNPDWRAEFSQALGRWNGVTDLFDFTTDPAPGASSPGACNSSAPSSVFFLPHACGSAFGTTTLAVTRTYWFAGGEAIHSDIVFNSAKAWEAFDDDLAAHTGADFRRVAVHESGHVLGLGHPYHSDAIMYFAQQGVIAPKADDLNGLKSIYGILAASPSPDTSGNSTQELVTMRSAHDGTINAEVRDANAGSLLRTLSFLNTSFAVVDSVVLPDSDGNGAPELAVLATRKSDGRGVVEIRNLSGLEMPRVLWFGEGLTPRKIVAVGDADSNGVTEMAVLSTRDTDDRAVVEVKNSFGATFSNTIWFMRFATPLDVISMPDADGNGVPEIAVLLSRFADGRGVVEVKNAMGATSPRTVWAMSGVTVKAIDSVGDADSNGVPEVAILSSRNSDRRIVAEIKNASGPSNPRALWFAAGHVPLALVGLPDTDANGVPELAVLSRRAADGRVVVEVKNAAGPTNPNQLWLSTGLDPTAGVMRLDDVDGNAVPEVAVLLSKRSDGRLIVEQRNVRGPQATRQTWLSPDP